MTSFRFPKNVFLL